MKLIEYFNYIAFENKFRFLESKDDFHYEMSREYLRSVYEEIERIICFEMIFSVDIDVLLEDKYQGLKTISEMSEHDKYLVDAIKHYNSVKDALRYNELSERFVFYGDEENLRWALEIIERYYSVEIPLESILHNKDLLRKDDHVDIKKQTLGHSPNAFCITRQVWNFNINISALTLVAIALALDIHLTLGFASAALIVMGVNGRAIAKISAEEAEKCLIMEAIRKKNHIIDSNVLSDFKGECVHNDINCKYRIDDKCTIKETDIKDVLDRLSGKNIFTKAYEVYKYNF